MSFTIRATYPAHQILFDSIYVACGCVSKLWMSVLLVVECITCIAVRREHKIWQTGSVSVHTWNGREEPTELVPAEGCAGSLNNLCPLTASILTSYFKRSRRFIVNVKPAILVITMYERALCRRRFEGTCLNFGFPVLSLHSNFYPEYGGRKLLVKVSNTVDMDVVQNRVHLQ